MKLPSHPSKLVTELETCLQSEKSFFGLRKKVDISRAVDILNELEQSGDWSIVPNLVQFILAPEPEIAETTGRCIEMLLRNIRPSRLPQLDERLRGSMYYTPASMSRWHDLKTFTENKYVAKNIRVGVTGLASFHGSGYIREAAINHLAKFTSGGELPFLLIRLYDWIPQVRIAAEIAVEQRITSDYLPHFLHNLPLLIRVTQKQRFSSDAKRNLLIERVLSELLQPSNRKFLLDALQDEDYEVRRTCLKIVRNSDIDELVEITNLAIRDKNATNRQIAVELSSRLPYLDRLKMLNQLLWDRNAYIRLESLRTLCDEQSESSTSLVVAALSDGSPALRQFARWKLTDLDVKIDLKQFYTEQIASNKDAANIAGAVDGFAEIGTPEDAPALVTLVLNPSVIVRKSALRALARLDARNYAQLFVQQLQSETPGVSRGAANALELTMESITGEELWTIFTATSIPHVKRNVLRLLNKTNQWERVTYLLLATSSDDPRWRSAAVSYLRAWHDEFGTIWAYTKPTPQQLNLLITAMKALPAELPIELRETLRQCIKLNT